jgi:hypothetical protein
MTNEQILNEIKDWKKRNKLRKDVTFVLLDCYKSYNIEKKIEQKNEINLCELVNFKGCFIGYKNESKLSIELGYTKLLLDDYKFREWNYSIPTDKGFNVMLDLKLPYTSDVENYLLNNWHVKYNI